MSKKVKYNLRIWLVFFSLIILNFYSVPITNSSDNDLFESEMINNDYLSINSFDNEINTDPGFSQNNLASAFIVVDNPKLLFNYGIGPGPYDRGDVIEFKSTITNSGTLEDYYKVLFEIYIDDNQDFLPDSQEFIDFFYCGPTYNYDNTNVDWGEYQITQLIYPGDSQDITARWLCKSDWPSNTHYTVRVRLFDKSNNFINLASKNFYINSQMSYDWPDNYINDIHSPGWININNYSFNIGDPITFEFSVITTKLSINLQTAYEYNWDALTAYIEKYDNGIWSEVDVITLSKTNSNTFNVGGTIPTYPQGYNKKYSSRLLNSETRYYSTYFPSSWGIGDFRIRVPLNSMGKINLNTYEIIKTFSSGGYSGKLEFNQYANLADKWIGSILQASNSIYKEGMSVPQRLILTEIDPTAGDIHTLTFKHQATKGGIHAYDFLTSWNQGNVPPLSYLPCGENIGATIEVVCDSLHTSGYSISVDVPDDPFISIDGLTQDRLDAYEGTWGNRQIQIYGNMPFTSASLTLNHDVPNYGDTSDSYINYELNWISGSDQIIIEMAGHLSVTGNQTANPIAWGEGVGSSQISGGPYHFSLGQIDSLSMGNQDNQISGASILLPGCIDVEKSVSTDNMTWTNSLQVQNGTNIFWMLNLENCYNDVLVDVTINDSNGFNAGPFMLGDSQIVTYYYNTTAFVDFNNTAIGSGQDTSGNIVTDIDYAYIDVINPCIDVEKWVSRDNVSWVELEHFVAGETVYWKVWVRNCGDVVLSNVMVTDDNGMSYGPFTLASLVEDTFYYSTVASVDFVNTVDAVGIDPTGGSVSDSDDAFIDVVAPCIDVEKWVSRDNVSWVELEHFVAGETVYWKVWVRNCGDVVLSNVMVTDDNGMSYGPFTLASLVEDTFYYSTVASVDFVNTVDAVGIDPTGGSVSDSDDAFIDVVAPCIDVEKWVSRDNVSWVELEHFVAGETVYWKVWVRNCGDVVLSNVMVTDDNGMSYGPFTLASLVEDTFYYSTVASVDFVNTVDAVGIDPTGGSVSDSDDAFIDVVAPCIDVEKWVSRDNVSWVELEHFVAGETVYWKVWVRNCGDVVLSNVMVTDDNGMSYGPFTLASLVEDTFYYSTVASVDFVNTVDAVGIDPTGGSVSDSDDAFIDVVAPCIDVEKWVSRDNVSWVELEHFVAGETVYWKVWVRNCGDVVLSNVMVTDDNGMSYGPFTLASLVEDTFYYSTVASVDFVNTVDAVGIDPTGGSVSDSDDAFIDVVAPCIDVEKWVSRDNVSWVELEHFVAGETVYWKVWVRNCGDVVLSNVMVTDDNGMSYGPFTLASLVEDTFYYSTVASVDFVNTVDAVGIDPTGGSVSDSDDAFIDVVAPCIDVEKWVSRDNVSWVELEHFVAGETVYWKVWVRNCGDVVLSNVMVTDDNGMSYGPFTLASLVEDTFYYSTVASVDFVNTVDAVGIDPTGGSVSDSDDAFIDVVAPCIDVEKWVSRDNVSWVELEHFVAGETVYWKVWVRNCGDVVLSNVMVTDDNGMSYGPFTLASLVEDTFYYSTVASVDFVNTVDAVGIDPTGGSVSDSDDAFIDVVAPCIDVEKWVSRDNVSWVELEHFVAGETVYWKVWVRNCGDVVLSNVMVTDDNGMSYGPFTLASLVEDTFYYSTVASVDFVNTVDAVGIDPTGGSVSDSDDAFIDVVAPCIDVEKWVSRDNVSWVELEHFVAGETVYWKVWVRNCGDIYLDEVTIGDDNGVHYGPLTLPIGLENVFFYSTIASINTVNEVNATGCIYFNNEDQNIKIKILNILNVLNLQTSYCVWDLDTASISVIEPKINIEKSVWNGTAWTDGIRVNLGTHILFKVEITNIGQCDIADITVTDTLSSKVRYKYQANYTPDYESLNLIIWSNNLPIIKPGETISITYLVEAVEICYGYNLVNVTSYGKIYEDSVSVKVVDDDQQPYVDIKKQVYDFSTMDWNDKIRSFVGDTLTFRIIINNSAFHIVHDIFVTDTLPDFLQYTGNSNYSEYFISPGFDEVIWYFDELEPGDEIEIVYTAKLVSGGIDDNLAVTTANEPYRDEDSVLIESVYFSIVNLLYPEGGETLSGTAKIKWFAIDSILNQDLKIFLYYSANDGYSWIQINGILNNNIDNTHGEYNWDTTGLSDGYYILMIEVINNVNAITKYTSDSFKIINGNEGVQVSDININNLNIGSNSWVKDGDNIEINAAITGGSNLNSMDILADLSGFGGDTTVEADSFNGFTAKWIINNVECTPSEGEITVKVTADDISSNSETIRVDNTNPKVNIIKPVNGLYFFNTRLLPLSKIIILGSITFYLDLDDNNAIDRTEFYIDDDLKHTNDGSLSEWYMRIDLKGNHVVDVITYDLAGNSNQKSIEILKLF